MRKIKSDDRSDQNEINREIQIAFELFKPKTFTQTNDQFYLSLKLDSSFLLVLLHKDCVEAAATSMAGQHAPQSTRFRARFY